MSAERTSVRLDVRAGRSCGAAIDGVTSELIQTRLTPSKDQLTVWLGLDEFTSCLCRPRSRTPHGLGPQGAHVDLMRALHRLSNPLVRQGTLYSGQARTAAFAARVGRPWGGEGAVTVTPSTPWTDARL